MKKLTVKQQKQVIELIRRNLYLVNASKLEYEKAYIVVNHYLDLLENGYEEHIPFEAYLSL